MPLLGKEADAVTITEGGQIIFANGEFDDNVAAGVTAGTPFVDERLGGVRFAVIQGSYTFELLG